MAGSRSALAIVACVMVVMALAHSATARRLTVGGPLGWSEQGMEFGRDPSFYQNWTHQYFPAHTNDELEFRWVFPETVLQVTFADFTACNTRGAIRAWFANRGEEPTSMVFPLRDFSFHTLYFISGNAEHCLSGQKFAIVIFE